MRFLIVVDMQNDFINGSLGTKEAEGIVSNVVRKINEWPDEVIFTRDTHKSDYLLTQEGKNLPVEHCIKNTHGWQIREEVAAAGFERDHEPDVIDKPTFASKKLAKQLATLNKVSPIEEIELVGLCTDICVVSNALMLKGFLPEVPISVDASSCAGVTPEKHLAALETMRSCQINVYNA